jgi:tetratricopeptide (TPR) repeat protein
MFGRWGWIEDLEQAIQKEKHAVAETSGEDENFARRLNNLGNMLGRRYERTRNVGDLEEAIHVNRQAVDITPDNYPALAAMLSNLGNRLGRLYEYTKRMEDLEEAIRVARRAVSITSKGHPDLATMLNNLSNKLGSRYQRTQKMEDLKEAIQVAREAVDSTPEDNPRLVGILSNLGHKLSHLYERTRMLEDLDEVVQVTRQAIQFMPKDYPDLSGRLNELGQKLEIRYACKGIIADLEESIEVTRKAVDITPKNYPGLVELLNNLGNKLCQRYKRTGRVEDIEEAIQLGQRATRGTFKDYPDLFGRLGNLGLYLLCRYQRIGKIEDLEEAIRVQRQAIEFTPENHPYFTSLLHNLGHMFDCQYKRTGRMEDLEEATRIGRQVIDATPKDHPDIAGRLHSLGQELESWYERTEKMENLEEAIRLVQQAVDITPRDNPDLAGRLVDLGNMLDRQYGRTGRIEDLTEAVQVARRAIDITPRDHRDLAGILTNLGRLLCHEYDHTKKTEKLEEAMQIAQKSVIATPQDDLKLGIMLSNLGNILCRQHECTGKIEDLTKAIRVARQSVDVTPKDHPALAGSLKNLGNALTRRYGCLGRNEDLEDAIKVTQQAWNCENAAPFVRINASILALTLLQCRGDFTSAYDLSVRAINLLPYVHDKSLNHQDQQYVVSRFAGLATSACALALQTGRSPEEALELLERGRGVILGLLMDNRGDVSKLKAAHPTLCAQYENLRSEVNTPIENRTDSSMRRTTLRTRTEASVILEKCIRKIQQLPGFSQFHQGFTAKQMQNCATEGSIVVVNITRLRSDAIIVNADAFKVLSLPSLSAPEAENWICQGLTKTSSSDRGRKNKAYHQFLSWLWYGCVRPVLDELHCYTQSSVEGLPRIWWIGTGPASSFPFHSAGDMSAGLMESAYYRAISSYTPTIKALQYAREHAGDTSLSQDEPWRVVIVAMPETPGINDLPETRREISEVISAIGSSASIETLVHPDITSTMAQLQHCNIAHFACHGKSDPIDPSSSGLILQTAKTTTEESMQDILSVREVSQAQLSQARIAYLSACSTAQNQVEALSDEVLHVVSGFQVAGFRHVVGCLWPSDDEVCVDVAKSFYAELIQGGDMRVGSDRATAVALHRAIVKVRESREFRKRPLLWAQYVHFGA